MNHHPTADPMAFFGPVLAKPWAAFRSEVLELYKPPKRAKPTYAGMKLVIRQLEELDIPVTPDPNVPLDPNVPPAVRRIESTSDLTVPLIGRFVDTRNPALSPNSVRGSLRYAQALCSYASSMRYVAFSPFVVRGVGKWVRPVPPAHKQFASKADIRKVLDHAASRITGGGWCEWKARREHAFLATLVYTGARYSEVVYLQAADVDFERQTIAIVSRKEHRLKTTGAHAVLPLLPELAPILRSWFEHRLSAPPDFELDDAACAWGFPTLRRHQRAPWRSGGPGQRPNVRVRILAAEVGVRLTPLMCRHSFASHLAAGGAGEHIVRQWLRHSSNQTQRYYVHPQQDEMKSFGSRLGY